MGVPTADIARLFLVPTATMAARLTRARKSLAGESVRRADRARSSRTASAARPTSPTWPSPPATRPPRAPTCVRTDLAAEAIRLARLLRELLPGRAPSSTALLGLMLLQHSRRDARVRDGRLVLLPDQDRPRWHADEITEALDAPHAARDRRPARRTSCRR